jgi:anti-anti-sigma regulatory factor
MNLQVTEEGQWYRFRILEKDTWTSSTFFPQLDSVLARIKTVLSEKPGARILFDLLALDTIDSSLITILVQTVRMTGVDRVSVLVSHPDVFGWLALLGLDRLAEIFDSEEAWRQKQKKPDKDYTD